MLWLLYPSLVVHTVTAITFPSILCLRQGTVSCRFRKGRGMFRYFILLLALCAVSGAGILFEDYFDTSSAVGWTEYSSFADSANYYIDSGWYHMEINYDNGGVYSLNGDDQTAPPHVMSIPDYSFYCKAMAWDATTHVGFGARMGDPINIGQGYALWLRYNSQDIVLFRHDGPGSNYVILDTEPFTLAYGDEYWIRFKLEGGHLQGKVWQGALGDEPSFFMLEAYDLTYSDPGSILIGCQSWGLVQNHAAFDSVIVEDPLSLETETWGAIKVLFQ